MKASHITIFILLLLPFHDLAAQPAEIKHDFRPPVDFQMLLSGTFGELRSDHFHSGIDIKTNGRGGEKIFAIDDGYISRIKVSPFGFGKTLYINHPGGYTSVYAHLDRFSPAIDAYCKLEQYRVESFAVDFFPEEDDLPVSRGDLIAMSGNSGSSYGPHLHFEIRDEATQVPMNPLMFGFSVKDYIRPKIRRLKVYPVEDRSSVNGSSEPVTFEVEGWGEVHRLPHEKKLKLAGEIAFGIDTYDLLNDASNKNGVYSVSLAIDGEEVFRSEMSSFAFNESRYINSLIDYAEFINSRVRFQRTEVDPNNALSIYRVKKDNGRYQFNEERTYELVFTVQDIAGNISRLNFLAEGTADGNFRSSAVGPDPGSYFFDHADENVFEAPGVMLTCPPRSFYRSFYFEYDTLEPIPGTYSGIHRLHDEITPVHTHCELRIQTRGLPPGLKEKSLIVKILDDGTFSAAGGEFEEGEVVTRIREFGAYAVVVDTVAPVLKPVKPDRFSNLRNVNQIRFKGKDELSGLDKYEATMNGEWLLMEYDAKNDLFIYDIDERLGPGENAFSLTLTDQKGNETTYETILKR